MERRRETRFAVDQPATVTRLNMEGRTFTAVIANVSGVGLCLRSPQPAEPGWVLRIDSGAGLLLGEVVHCRPEPGGLFLIGLRIEHALYNAAEYLPVLEAIAGRSEDRREIFAHR